MATLKPLAVGLVRHRPHTPELVRSRARVALAAYAHRQGYCLLETFEIDGNPVRDDLALTAFAALVRRSRAHVVITRGNLPPAAVGALTPQARVRVLATPVEPATVSPVAGS